MRPYEQVQSRWAAYAGAVFHILLALYGGERYGYDIMQKVREDSQGAVKMGPETLYGSQSSGFIKGEF